ncbi:MAG TPA: cobalamin B12-binding domain-containing protein [Nitrososphaeraceae archaeon]|nr:cobalamin B12-binding domain-containing protein [Nitrososphaeraceae archaeon]
MKGHSYAYLVKNVWDKKNERVRQEIVKYLGRSSKVALEDFPKEFQKDPNVVTFIACHSSDAEKNEFIMKEKMLELLIRNDTNSLVDIFERYSQFFGLVKFYERLLAPVMYKVGELWKAGKLNVATEHVCSNAAHTLVKIINEKFSRNPVVNRKALKILICTPEGEYHSLGCMVIESFLRSKGCCVSNIAPSVPSDAIIAFAGKFIPDLIMISITLDENIGAANKLINKILESRINVPPILVGGIGTESITIKSQNDKLKKVKFLKGIKLSGILPSIREATKDRPKLSETITK